MNADIILDMRMKVLSSDIMCDMFLISEHNCEFITVMYLLGHPAAKV